jgi:ADP-heptose:LPS heptosyltransferase
MSKKILYIKAQWLGDIIWGLPFLIQQKKLGNKVYQTFYDMRHLNKGLKKFTKEQQEHYKRYPMYQGRYSTLEILKKSNLIQDIIFIPYEKYKLFFFFLKYLLSFNEAIIPIKTNAWKLLGSLLARSKKIIFQNTNDISKFRTLSDGECNGTGLVLHECLEYIDRPTEEVKIEGNYITIFSCIFERSLDIKEWIAIIDFAQTQGLKVVIVGWIREKWFIDELEKLWVINSSHVINMLDKTNIAQLSYLLKNAKYCISGNWGPMRIANLMNPNCINIHTTSSFLMEPKVNNKTSFNLRGYHYPECVPCESADSTIWGKRISGCVFYNTIREGECRKFNTAEQVILILQKIVKK